MKTVNTERLLNNYTDQQLLVVAKEALAAIPEEGRDCDKKLRSDLRDVIEWLESKRSVPTA